MGNKILVENKFGHGAKYHPILTKIRRWRRPLIGKASIPFDWTAGFDIEQKIGVVPTKNQFQSDSCGGQAKSYLIGVITSLLTQKPYVEKSAKSIYSPIFVAGGGTTDQLLEQDKGCTDESVVPSTLNGGCDEPFMEDTSWMTAPNIVLELQNRGWQAISVNIDINSIAEAIRDYGAVIWNIRGENNGTWLSSYPQPPIAPLNLWGHFMCAGGAKTFNGNQVIKAFQSWGDTVGDNGRQYFQQNYIDSGYIIDVFTFQHINAVDYKFNQFLCFGMTNNDVLKLQQRLGVQQTGYFGWSTLYAVLAYQKANGLSIRGWVNQETMNYLNNH